LNRSNLVQKDNATVLRNNASTGCAGDCVGGGGRKKQVVAPYMATTVTPNPSLSVIKTPQPLC